MQSDYSYAPFISQTLQTQMDEPSQFNLLNHTLRFIGLHYYTGLFKKNQDPKLGKSGRNLSTATLLILMDIYTNPSEPGYILLSELKRGSHKLIHLPAPSSSSTTTHG